MDGGGKRRGQLLLAFFPNALQEEVVLDLIQSPGLGNARFRERILPRVRISGFSTDNAAAPPKLQVRAVLGAMRRHLSYVIEILGAWLLSDVEAVEAILAYIQNNYSEDEQHQYSLQLEDVDIEEGMCACTELLDAYRAYVGRELSEEEVLRFIGTVLFPIRLSLPDKGDLDSTKEVAAGEEVSGAVEEKPDGTDDIEGEGVVALALDMDGDLILNRLICQLEAIEPDDEFWDSIDLFISQVGSIAEAKCKQRVNWQAVEEMFSEIDKHSEDLTYFAIDSTSWSRDTLPPEHVADFIGAGKLLLQCLDRHTELRSVVPKDLQQRRALDAQMTEVEDSILGSFRILRGLFTSCESESQEHEERLDKHDGDGGKGGATFVDAPIDEVAEAPDGLFEEAWSSLADYSAEEVERQSADVLVGEISGSLADDLVRDVKTPPANDLVTEVAEASMHESVAEVAKASGAELVTKAAEDDGDKYEDGGEDAPQPGISSIEPTFSSLEPKPVEEETSGIADPLPEREDGVESTLWQCLSVDPWGFWWNMRCRELTGEPQLVPKQAVSAFLAGEAVLLRVLEPLHLDSHLAESPGEEPLERMAALSVGMAASLTAAFGDSRPWLAKTGFLPAVDEFIEALKEFSMLYLPWRLSASGKSEREIHSAMQLAQEQAKAALEEAPRYRMSFARASQLYRYIMTDGDVGRALRLIQDGSLQHLEVIQDCIKQWGTQERIQRKIAEIDLAQRKRNERAVVGHPLGQLVRLVDEQVDILKRWLDCAVMKEHMAMDFLDQQCISLHQTAASLLPEGMRQIEECLAEDQPPSIHAGLSLVQRTLVNIQYFMGLRESLYDLGEDLPALNWWYDGAERIEDALARRCLWHPELTLDDDGLPLKEEAVLSVDWKRPPSVSWMLSEGCLKWIEKQDYRFIRQLLGLDESGAEKLGLPAMIEEHKRGSRHLLEERKHQTSMAIQRALVEGRITDVANARYESVLSGMVTAHIDSVIPALDQLDAIEAELEREKESVIEQLRSGWEEKQHTIVATISDEYRQQLHTAMETAFAERDIRLIQELMANPDALSRLDKGESRDYYSQFLAFRPIVERERSVRVSLAQRCMDAIKKTRTWAGIPYGNLPPAHRNQSLEALQAWQRLFSMWGRQHARDRNSAQSAQLALQSIFSFLGFSGRDGDQTLWEELNDGGYWVHYRAYMSAGIMARPFPQFGSLTNDTYNIICVWDRPGADSLGRLIHDARLEAKSTIILYFGRLSDSLQRDIMAMSRKRRLAVAVLDESMLVFLTKFTDARISVFLRAALPFSALIPYTPFLRGDVPPEIYYGREESVQDLQRADGTCLVYGGRQMGKSALLRQVQRRFHNPEHKQYAWVEDVLLLCDVFTGSQSEDLWPRVWRAFSRMGLLRDRNSPDSVDVIIERIDELFARDPDLRVLLLLDEADSFLNRDAVEGFRVVNQLRKLMTDHQRRFRVVFAGLQDVQRFQSLPNQPLANFGTPIQVGPLEVPAAMDLIREPLEALGFTIDDSCILQILSFTNYHPGLIQTFCYHLLERLYNQPKLMSRRRGGPVAIDRELIESIYLSSEVRREIRERFELTLALDHRYHAIALYLVIHHRDPETSALQPANVHTILQGLREWWPEVFADMPGDEFRGLMVELANLGVVVQDHTGSYQLRSPNLVSLMGTDTEIQERFLDLVSKPPPDPKDSPDSYHALIDATNQVYSPLTFKQERSLNDSFDFRIITCSRALGLESIELAIKSIARGFSAGQDTTRRLPASALDEEAVERFLRKHIDIAKKRGRQRLVVYQILQENAHVSLGGIKAAWAWFNQYASKRKPLKLSLIFVLDPQAFREALLTESDFIDQMDEQGLILHSRTWDTQGITQRLTQFEKNSITSVNQVLYRVSGGWPILLDDIMVRCAEAFDPSSMAKELERELGENEEDRERFLRAVGIEEPDVLAVVKRLAKEDVPSSLAVPELLELDDRFNDEHFQLALYYLQAFDVVRERHGVYRLDHVVKRLVNLC